MARRSRSVAYTCFEKDPHVYALTLLVDVEGWKAGAMYIGQSQGNRKGYVTGGKIPIELAKVYGWNIFVKRILAASPRYTREDLSDLERLYIEEYDTINSGMNLFGGGAGNKTARRLYRYALDGSYIDEWESPAAVLYHFGGHHGNLNNCIRTLKRSVNTTNRAFWGFLWSREKLDRVNRFKSTATSFVYQYDLDGNFIRCFDSGEAASKAVDGRGSGHIRNVVDVSQKSAAGYQWRSFATTKIEKYIKLPSKADKPVFMCDDDFLVIKRFNTVREAARESGEEVSKIRRFLKSESKIAFNGGYKWRYAG